MDVNINQIIDYLNSIKPILEATKQDAGQIVLSKDTQPDALTVKVRNIDQRLSSIEDSLHQINSVFNVLLTKLKTNSDGNLEEIATDKIMSSVAETIDSSIVLAVETEVKQQMGNTEFSLYIDHEKIAREVDVNEVANNIEVGDIAREVDLDDLAAKVAESISMDDVAEAIIGKSTHEDADTLIEEKITEFVRNAIRKMAREY